MLISGFCASISMRAAFSTSSLSGRMRIGTSNLLRSQTCALARPSSVLVGSDRNTGPHGGVEANFKPRRVVSAIAAVDCACQNHLVIGSVISS